jgi:hypothetical protein
MRMKLTIGAVLAALVMAGGPGAAMAQPRPDGFGVRVHHHRHVAGPVYDRRGEELGPAYWGTTGPEAMPNPATCGPGACQDNPLY